MDSSVTDSIVTDGDPPTMDTPSSIPTTSSDGGTLVGVPKVIEQVPIESVDSGTLVGIPNIEKHLLDLVQSQPENVQGNTLPVNVGNTEEELEAASMLLSPGDMLDDTLEKEDENALLMPIGGTNDGATG